MTTTFNFSSTTKKILFTALIALMPTLFFAQVTAFDKYDGQDDVTSVVMNKKTFQMLGNMKLQDKEAGKFIKQIHNVDSFKMFSTSSIKISEDMKKTFETYRKQQNLEPLMNVKDDGQVVSIYVKSAEGSDSKVKEFVMFIEPGDKKGEETVLLALTGDFDLSSLNDDK